MTQNIRVGFIGLGMMGNPMSKRILAAGYSLTVHDIRPEPVEDLVQAGATKADSPEEIASVSDVVLTSLPTLKASEDVYLGNHGLLKGGRAGTILVETSTVSPHVVKRFADEAREQGVMVVDASLYARSSFHPGLLELKANEVAARGLVTVQVGGDPNDVEMVRPILSTFGNPILHLGPIGSGMMAKVIQNAVTHANFCIACEALAVAAKADMDLRKLLDTMGKVGSKSWIVEHAIPAYLEQGEGRMMRTEVAVKDSQSMLDLGRELGVPLLMQSIKHSYYEWARHSGLEDRPWDEMLQLWEGVIGKPIKFEG
jgi:3-hydroxyisobutyrate dehydrogenase-like beta-hydroxyacid dehydrogenase